MSVLVGGGPGSTRRAPSERRRRRRSEPLGPPTRSRVGLVRGRTGPVGGTPACRPSGAAARWPWLLALGLAVAAVVAGLGLFAGGVTAGAGSAGVLGVTAVTG